MFNYYCHINAKLFHAFMSSHVTGKMLLFVKIQDNSVEEIELNSKQPAQDCLDEICRRIEMDEEDYFGLIMKNSEKKIQWLNMKNSIVSQLQGHQPYWLELKVKYHVEPHLLQQVTTRHLFYLEAKKSLQDGELLLDSVKKAALITALIAQADYGDYNPQQLNYLCCPTINITDEFKLMVVTEHNRLRGMRRTLAEYKLIQEVYLLENYGVKFWDTVIHTPCKFGVGPRGIVLQWNDQDTPVEKRIVYSALDGSGAEGKYCDISYKTADYGTQSMRFKLSSREQAEGLYRSIIETYTFFIKDTIPDIVQADFTRDWKGLLAHVFREKTTLGIRYMFDIRRTAREVYDHTCRSVLNRKNQDPFANIPDRLLCEESEESEECSKVKEDEALKCRVCEDRCIDRVFPCGHVSCANCASRLRECHMCRGVVEPTWHIYLPV